MKATVNTRACNGCTICNITCPEIFAIGDNGKAQVRMGLVPHNYGDICIEAADECPMNAIQVETAPVYASRSLVYAKMSERDGHIARLARNRAPV